MRNKRKIYMETTEGWLIYLALKKLPIENILNLCFDDNVNIRDLAISQAHVSEHLEIIFDFAVNACYSKSYLKRESGILILSQLGCNTGYPFKNKTLPFLKMLINNQSIIVKQAVLSAIGHLFRTEYLEDLELISKIISLRNSKSINLLCDVAFALGSCKPSNSVIFTLKKMSRNFDEDVSDWAKISLDNFTIDGVCS